MSKTKTRRPYGKWQSQLTGDALAAAMGFEDVGWLPDGAGLLWLESRGGTNTLVAQAIDASGQIAEGHRDLTEGQNLRGRVGYGGGALCVGKQAAFYACDDGLFTLPFDHGPAKALIPQHGTVAAPAASPDGDWLLYVHRAGNDDCLALVDAAGERWPQRLASGADFYMQPSWHPDSQRLAWVEWDHPNMPWDGSRLILATLRFCEGSCVGKETQVVAGGDETAVFQPTFSPDGRTLAFASDESGRGEIYLHQLDGGATRKLSELPGELDQPAWAQGQRSFCFSADGARLFAVENHDATSRLWSFDVASGEATVVPGLADYTAIGKPCARPGSDQIALLAASATVTPRVLCVSATSEAGAPAHAHVVRRSTAERIPPAALAEPEPVTFVADDGETSHGLLYRPHSLEFESDGLPPALVSIHGGPTGQSTRSFSLRAQYFATRGFAVLEVNHRGSSGCGRAYRRALDGNWGVFDVADAVAGRRWLEREGLADPQRVGIIGGSAGGYTVLRTLTEHPGLFAVGLSLYGISNLLTLAASTHKFEARYLDRLVGPLPQAAELYRERSPLFAAERICDPVAIFQGSDDRVVPPDQAEAIVASLRQRSVPHAYHLYEGEGHGWRKPETIRRFWADVDAFIEQHLV
jgi:dipeptidyl aminopeptidase/acylaminoacyl peptidase